MTLLEAELGKRYTVKEIITEEEALDDFLFTLGCYAGEEITVVSHISSNFVVSIKDGRYNIDRELAQAISVL